jgi:hypothetical protein
VCRISTPVVVWRTNVELDHWRRRSARATIKGVLAAALTIWGMFSLWVIGPTVCAPAAIPTTALGLVAAELVALGLYSYGVESCRGDTCLALAQAAGVAARTDVPILAALFVVLALVRLRRRPAR